VKDLLTLNDELVISVDLTVAIRLQGGFTNGPPVGQLFLIQM
jgi:hypothetical protein